MVLSQSSRRDQTVIDWAEREEEVKVEANDGNLDLRQSGAAQLVWTFWKDPYELLNILLETVGRATDANIP